MIQLKVSQEICNSSKMNFSWKTGFFNVAFAGVEVQIGSEVDPLLELARVKEEREKVLARSQIS